MQPENRFHSSPGTSFHVLLRYNELETARWEQWFHKQPGQVMDLPAGDSAAGRGTVRDLLFHIFLVEWAYAKVLQRRALGRRVAEIRP
jgi:hypothetical protein